jgi:hypothetical protein
VNTRLNFNAGDRPLDNEIEGLKKMIVTGELTEIVKSRIDLN